MTLQLNFIIFFFATPVYYGTCSPIQLFRLGVALFLLQEDLNWSLRIYFGEIYASLITPHGSIFLNFFFYSQSFPACSWLNDTYTLLTSILIMFESFKLSMQPNSSWFLFTIGPLTCYFYFIIWCQDILKRANAKVAQAIFFYAYQPSLNLTLCHSTKGVLDNILE